jgi:DNA-binding NarL/FixJ family response regulator
MTPSHPQPPTPIRVLLLHPSPERVAESPIAPSANVVLLATLGLETAAQSDLVGMSPDVAIVDLRGSEVARIDALLRGIQLATPRTQLVAICGAGDDAMAQQALKAGAAACLTRHTDPLSVLRAINDVWRGRMHLSPTGQRAIRHALGPTKDPADRG